MNCVLTVQGAGGRECGRRAAVQGKAAAGRVVRPAIIIIIIILYEANPKPYGRRAYTGPSAAGFLGPYAQACSLVNSQVHQ